MGKESITKMTSDCFWELIEEMKECCGQDMEWAAQWMMNRLCKLPPEQVLQFHLILQGYKEAANKYGLWTVAGLIKDTGCSDDGFIDFRAWLIAQGKDVYMAALEDPDSLSDVQQYGSCEFESFNYVASKAYGELTGRDIYGDYTDAEMKRVQKELLQGIRYHPMIGFPLNPPEAAVVYPKAGEQFAQKYDINNPAFASVWNTSLPELKKLEEEGKREAHKYQKDRRQMGKKDVGNMEEWKDNARKFYNCFISRQTPFKEMSAFLFPVKGKSYEKREQHFVIFGKRVGAVLP